MNRKSSVVIWAVAAVTAVGWILTFIVATANASSAERLGQFGDTFGAANALFSGASLLILVIVLLIDQQHRKSGKPPYIAPSIASHSVVVKRKDWLAETFFLAISFDFNVENLSPEVALGIVPSAEVSFRNIKSVPTTPDQNPILPLAPSGASKKTFTFTLHGSEATSVLNEILSNESAVSLDLKVAYSSLTGSRWQTGATYRLIAREPDKANLRAALIEDSQRPPEQVLSPNDVLDASADGLRWSFKEIRK